MDDRPYYYRLRGRTLGPVGLRQIRQLAQRAQIGRTTDVSRDGMQWAKAGDYPEIFEVADVAPPVISGPVSGGDPSYGLGPTIVPAASSGPKWYYAVAGVQKGPVDLATLQNMVATGQLAGTDHVFPEGGSDWLPVNSVPQLAGGSGGGGMSVGGAPIINVNVPRQTSPQSEGSNGMAIAGFVLSLVGCPPLGLIFSLIALNSRNKANRGLAIAGAIISGVFILCGCGYAVILMIVAAGANA